jgi:hypothetical protein
MELIPDSEANVSLYSPQDALLLNAGTIVLSRPLAPLVSQTCYQVAGGGGIDKTVCNLPG